MDRHKAVSVFFIQYDIKGILDSNNFFSKMPEIEKGFILFFTDIVKELKASTNARFAKSFLWFPHSGT